MKSICFAFNSYLFPEISIRELQIVTNQLAFYNVTFTSHFNCSTSASNTRKDRACSYLNSVFDALVCCHHTAKTFRSSQSDVKSCIAPVHGRPWWSLKPDEGWTCGNTVERATALRFPVKSSHAAWCFSLSLGLFFSSQPAQTDLSGL